MDISKKFQHSLGDEFVVNMDTLIGIIHHDSSAEFCSYAKSEVVDV